MTTYSAEDLLAGAMLLSDEVRHGVYARGVRPATFQSSLLRSLMAVVQEMDDLALPVETVAITAHASRSGVELLPDTIHELREAALANPRVLDSYGYYVDLVLENERKVRAVKAAQQVIEDYQRDPTLDIQDTLARALMQIQSPSREMKGGWLADLLPTFLQEVEDNWKGLNQPAFIPTGLRQVDAMLRGGMRPGELVIVGARPGMGKTAFGLQLANNAARGGKRVLVFSAEMTATALLRRASAEFTGTPAPLIDKRGPAGHERLEAQRLAYLRAVREEMIHLPVYLDDTSRPSVAYMMDKARRLGDIDLIIFDYLGLGNDGLSERATANEKMTRLSTDLMMMAKELQVPVVALSQLNRSVEQAKPYLPTLAHLRDSGSIEQNAHIVLMLYRKRYYILQNMLEPDGTEDEGDFLDIFVQKNREGMTGPARARFDGPTFRITND